MASSLRLILSLILFLSLITSGHTKTSTENLIVNESDILELKNTTEIEEGDFFEDVQITSEEYVWIVNLKNGPFPTEEKANQAALELKKTLGITLPKLPKEISILQKSKSPNNKNFNKAEFLWMINLSLGVYDSKDNALQIAQELKAIQKVPENVFLTREIKDIKTSKFSGKITPEVSGQIFLSREATPIKDKTKHFILVATKSKSLNVRKNPSISSPLIARLLRGSKVPHIKNNTPENPNGSWFYVEYSKGKFGWVSSSFTKKIIDLGSMTSQQANLKTVKPKQVQTSEAPRTSEFRELKSLVALLQTELNKIKADKAKATEATNQANTKANEEKLASAKEFQSLKNKSSQQIKGLRTTSASLHSEPNLIKLDKAKAIEATNQANTKANEEILASIKEFRSSKEKSSKQIKDLQKTTVSLSSELDMIKADKARAIEASNQANSKAKEERLANANEKNALQEKINTQRVVLDKFKSDKEKTTQATNQANTKATEEKLASIKKFNTLKEKSSEQIKDLQTTTVSLSSELDKIKSDKARAIEATNQANSKAEEERIASIQKFNTLKEKNSQQIKGLQTTTVSLQSQLHKIKADKAKAIEATNQANSKAKEEKLANANEKNALQEKINTLRVVLDKFKIDKEKTTQATNQANTKATEEKLASIKEFNTLKEKNSIQIKDLQKTTVSLSSELDMIKADKARAIEASNQANSKAKEERLANANEKNALHEKINTLRVVLDKFKSDKEKTTQATIQANFKAKEEKLASVKEFNFLKEKNSKQIKDLQTTTVSLRSELDKIKTDKAEAIETSDRERSTLQAERLANTEFVRSLKVNNENEISNLRDKKDNEIKNQKKKTLKQIADLKFSTASLQKELQKIKGDKEDAINAINQTNAKLQATNLNNLKFTKKLQDTVLFLRKELDKLKEEKTESIRAVNQANDKLRAGKLANSTETNNIKKESHKKILDLKTTVAYLRSELNKAKDDTTNKLTAINQASIKSNKRFKESSASEIKTLNSTIKNLRTVLERFQVERLKSAEARKFRETKIETEQTIREKEFNVLKKESIVLKLQLDKANLDRVKALEGINLNSIETQFDQIAQDIEFKEFRQKSAREIAELMDEATSLRNQLAHLKIDRTKANQPKTLLSSAEKLRGLTSPASTKQKNKTSGILDKPAKKKIIPKNKFLPSSTDINPESIINSKLSHWVKAWESQNIPLYLSFYSKSFWDPKKSRSLWESHRRKSLEKKINISIQISNIKIYVTSKNIIIVTFVQQFKSNKFSDIGLKELVWKKGTEDWKIIKETWRPR